MVETQLELGFESLKIDDWRQFDSVNLSFHPRLTVITGANACGKSTLLTILARHFNWTRQYSTAPTGIGKRQARWSPFGRRRGTRGPSEGSDPGSTIGELAYSNGISTLLQVYNSSEAMATRYDLILPTQQSVNGVNLTSHKAVSGNYAPVTTIPTMLESTNALFEQYTNELRVRWNNTWSGKTPQQAFKESLISAALFGEGNSSVEPNEIASNVWFGYQKILEQVLPDTLGFNRLRIRSPEVVIESASGDFVLDEISGGLSAIMEISWQIFLKSLTYPSFTVTMDEPENHLHPSLQREILPNLLRAFPRVQFVVATHSPFVVTSAQNSHVYVLEYNEQNRVISRLLDYANKAASADETLRRVLGMDSTMPRWAEEQFEITVNKYMGRNVSPESLRAMRDELTRLGLVGEVPQAIIDIADQTLGRGE